MQVPHSDAAVAAAGEADLGVRLMAVGVAGGAEDVSSALDARGWEPPGPRWTGY